MEMKLEEQSEKASVELCMEEKSNDLLIVMCLLIYTQKKLASLKSSRNIVNSHRHRGSPKRSASGERTPLAGYPAGGDGRAAAL